MEDLSIQRTAIITACTECAAEIHQSARYCRFCGAPTAGSTQSRNGGPWAMPTRPLQPNDGYRPVSGPLIEAVGAGFGSSRALQLRGSFARTLLFAFISLPVWLLIVLLSPVDAYLAARSIASGH
jgi:hypothetical protein